MPSPLLFIALFIVCFLELLGVARRVCRKSKDQIWCVCNPSGKHCEFFGEQKQNKSQSVWKVMKLLIMYPSAVLVSPAFTYYVTKCSWHFLCLFKKTSFMQGEIFGVLSNGSAELQGFEWRFECSLRGGEKNRHLLWFKLSNVTSCLFLFAEFIYMISQRPFLNLYFGINSWSLCVSVRNRIFLSCTSYL